MKFDEFEFSSSLIEGLDAMGFEKATPIQEQAIPLILSGKDIIAVAQTGTGKTGAFVLPLLELISRNPDQPGVKAIIIAPTRELANQIDQQIQGLGYFANVSSIAIYGGGSGDTWETQKAGIVRGADIIVATPGRLMAHMNMGYAKFDNLQYLILDEADRLMDMGFHDDIISINSNLPEKKQGIMFSATMPAKIRKLSTELLDEPENINIAISKPAEGVKQGVFILHDSQKIPLLKGILNGKNFETVLIFAATKVSVKDIHRTLSKSYKIAQIQSDLDQSERDNSIIQFKNKLVNVLVATDIVSRGLDVKGINLVVNFDLPGEPEDYIHRIGRTARADKTGTALSFVNPKDQRKLYALETFLDKEIRKIDVPAALGETPTYNPESMKRSGGGKSRHSNSKGGKGRNSKSHSKRR